MWFASIPKPEGATHHVFKLLHFERLGRQRRVAEKRWKPAQVSLAGHQDERNTSQRQFAHCRIDAYLAQLNAQQRAVDVVRAYCPQRLIEVADRPNDGASEVEQDLPDKLREEPFVLGDHHAEAAEWACRSPALVEQGIAKRRFG